MFFKALKALTDKFKSSIGIDKFAFLVSISLSFNVIASLYFSFNEMNDSKWSVKILPANANASIALIPPFVAISIVNSSETENLSSLISSTEYEKLVTGEKFESVTIILNALILSLFALNDLKPLPNVA